MANYDKKTGTNSPGILRMQITTSQTGNRTDFWVRFQLIVNNSATFGTFNWSGNTAGTSRSGTVTVNGRATHNLGTWTFSKTHTSAGNLSAQSFSLTLAATGTLGLGGPTTVSTSITPPRIPKVPGKPANITNIVPGPTNIAFRIGAPSDNGGSAITTYEFQMAYSNFGTVRETWTSGAVNQNRTGLPPGQLHYIRYRARNAVGNGPWSNVASTSTLNVNPPSFTVTASPNGTVAQITLGPPSTLPSPSGYRVNYVNTKNPGAPGVTITVPANSTWPFEVSDSIIAGDSYTWRAAVLQGTYQSEWTDWLTVIQPKPNLTAGDYFDGSFPTSGDNTFSWTGTAHASTSQMIAKAPQNFRVEGDFANRTSPYSGVYFALTEYPIGGVTAARLAFRTTTNLPWGIFSDLTETVPGGDYTGSVYARVFGEPKELFAVARLYPASIGSTVTVLGEGRLVSERDGWVRLSVSFTMGADRSNSGLGVQAVGWEAGDSLLVDRMQMQLGDASSYFDGSRLPDSHLYAWEGEAWESESSATLIPEVDLVDPFEDPDCDPIPHPPAPPMIVDDCIVEVGQWRRYWLQIPASEVGVWSATIPTLIISSGAVAARQIRIRYFPNPENREPSSFDETEYESEQIISYMPPNAIYELNGLTERAIGTTSNLPEWRDVSHLLYGTGGGPASWPEMRCGVAYLIALDVPIDAPDGNLSTAVELTRRF